MFLTSSGLLLIKMRDGMWLDLIRVEFRIIQRRQKSGTFSQGFRTCRNPNNGSTTRDISRQMRLGTVYTKDPQGYCPFFSVYLDTRSTRVYLRLFTRYQLPLRFVLSSFYFLLCSFFSQFYAWQCSSCFAVFMFSILLSSAPLSSIRFCNSTPSPFLCYEKYIT